MDVIRINNKCICGCNKIIPICPWHKYYKPKYIKGHAMRGKHHTEETKRKIGKSNSVSLLGKHHTKETKKKMSLAHKGKTFSKETKRKILENRKWYKPSLETRQKISMKLTGIEEFEEFKTPLNAKIRGSKEYKTWRKQIFERDNYTCQECSRRGCYLEAHHSKKSFSNVIQNNNINTFEKALNCDELWDINNGITYCKECHILLDKNRGKRGNSKNDNKR